MNFTPDQIQMLRTQVMSRPRNRVPSDEEVALFVAQCERTNLDPFGRQIYAVYRYDRNAGGDKMQVQVSIDGLRLIAERTGKYLGQAGPFWCGPDGEWRDVWLADGPPAAAKVGVWKAGAKEPTWSPARFSDYAQRTREGKLMGLWAQMPSVMISKCSEALSLRRAFPQEMSGLYIAEEMAQADNPSLETEPVNGHASERRPQHTPGGGGRPSDKQLDFLKRILTNQARGITAPNIDQLKVILTRIGLPDADPTKTGWAGLLSGAECSELITQIREHPLPDLDAPSDLPVDDAFQPALSTEGTDESDLPWATNES